MTSTKKIKLILTAPLIGAFFTLLLYFIFSLAPVNGSPAATTIIFVDQDSTAVSPDGTSWANAYPKLQDGLVAAGSPAAGELVEVWVAEGIYYPDEGGGQVDNNQFANFKIPNRVHLYGGFAGGETDKSGRDWENNLTVLSGDITQNDTTDSNGIIQDTDDIIPPNTSAVVEIGQGGDEMVLDGFVLTGGYLPSALAAAVVTNGGALAIIDSFPTVRNLHVIGNVGKLGGGVSIQHSSSHTQTVTFENILIESNEAENRGGGLNVSSALLNGNGVTIRNNFASTDGGGFYGVNSEVNLTNITMQGNVAQSVGGGAYLRNGSINLENFLIESNTSTNFASYGGGGMLHFDGRSNFKNGVIRGNDSNRHGGGLYVREGTSTLANVIVNGNKASSNGGGIIISSVGQLVATNITVSGNSADTTGGIVSNAPNALYQNSIIWGNSDVTSGAGSMRANFGQGETAMPIIWFSNIQGSGGSDAWVGVPFTNGGNNIDIDPSFYSPIAASFAPTITGNYKPVSTSIVIDLGLDGADLDGPLPLTQTIRTVDTDAAGDPRVQNIAVDMGAYEDTPLVSLIMPLNTTLVEGGTGITLSIRLSEEPPAGRRNIVTIPLSTSNDQCEVSTSTAVLSSANWDTGLEFSVSAVDDLEFDLTQSCTLITGDAVADAANFSGFAVPDIAFTIEDNDLPEVNFAAASLTITEAATTTITVSLAAEPPADTELTLTSENVSCELLDDDPISFTADNWSEGVTVPLSAFSDRFDKPDRTCVIAAELTPVTAGYASRVVPPLMIVVENDDTAEVSLTASSVAMVEGDSQTMTLTLGAQPSDPLEIDLTSDHADCELNPTGPALFDSSNWSTAITVSISVQDDFFDETDFDCTVSMALTTEDPAFAALTPDQLEIAVADNDTAGINVSDIVAEMNEGETQTIQVSLESQPTDPLELRLASDNMACELSDSGPFTFDADNWSAEISVVMTATQNSVDAPDAICTITSTVTTDDANYASLTPSPLNVTVQDDDTAGIEQIDASLNVDEAGQAAEIPFVLQSEPTDPVTVAFTVEGDCTLNPAELLFNSANWGTIQSVSVTPLTEDVSCVIHTVVRSDDEAYADVVIPTFNVAVADSQRMVFLPLVIR